MCAPARSRPDPGPRRGARGTAGSRGAEVARRRHVVEAIRETFAACCPRDRFRLVHYSIQSDHVHMIVEVRDQRALGREMMSVVSRLAFAVNRALGRRGKVVAGRYHARLLKSPRQVRNALRYVLLNLRKHRHASSGDAGPAVIDEASSGCWFDGWQKHGAIGLAEIPGARL